jgi:hypothetical protein
MNSDPLGGYHQDAHGQEVEKRLYVMMLMAMK